MASGLVVKTTTLGTCNAIAMDVREVYPRKTLLPSAWQRVRIGAFVSLVGLAGDDVDPATETITYITQRDRFVFGLSNSVAGGALGVTGFRFVGMATTTSTFSSTFSTPVWSPLGASSMRCVIGDGATVTDGGSASANTAVCSHNAPSGTADFAAFVGLEISLTSTGISASILKGGTSRITDTSVTNLRRLMLDTALTSLSTATGGWWGSGLDSGLQYLHIIYPHRSGRLRLHGLQVMQIG